MKVHVQLVEKRDNGCDSIPGTDASRLSSNEMTNNAPSFYWLPSWGYLRFSKWSHISLKRPRAFISALVYSVNHQFILRCAFDKINLKFWNLVRTRTFWINGVNLYKLIGKCLLQENPVIYINMTTLICTKPLATYNILIKIIVGALDFNF